MKLAKRGDRLAASDGREFTFVEILERLVRLIMQRAQDHLCSVCASLICSRCDSRNRPPICTLQVCQIANDIHLGMPRHGKISFDLHAPCTIKRRTELCPKK